ncbi:hypothetical protein PZA11_007322 [Diplocarpon coronariae]
MGIEASLSPAVKIMWSSFPTCLKKASMSCTTNGFDRSQAYPETMTKAPDSMDVFATAKPKPVSSNLDVYRRFFK